MDNIVNKTIVVGDLKMSLFSFIIAAAGIVLGLVISFNYSIFIGLITTASLFLAAYNLNCVIVGKCKTWAWILFVIYLLNVILSLLANFGLSYLYSPKSGSGSSSKKR